MNCKVSAMKVTNLGETPLYVKVGIDPKKPPIADKDNSQVIKPGESAMKVTGDGTVVLCHGVFDVLHLGHIRHLQEAAKMGNYLVVSVTADKHVNKGMGRPHFTAAQRAEA